MSDQPTDLEIYNDTGMLPEDDKRQEAVLQQVLAVGGEAKPAEQPKATEQQPAADPLAELKAQLLQQQQILAQEQQARLDAQNYALWAQGELAKRQQADAAQGGTVAPESTATQQEQAPTPMDEVLAKLKESEEEWGYSPVITEAIAALVKLNAEQAAKLEKVDNYFTQQQQREYQAQQDAITQHQNALQAAIDADPVMAAWQQNPAAWQTVTDLWDAARTNPALAALSPTDQVARCHAIAAQVLTTPAPQAAQGNVVDIKKPAAQKPAPIYSIGDRPGQGIGTADTSDITQMSDAQLAVALSKMDDTQFQAALNRRSA
jgi:hypothetical protein